MRPCCLCDPHRFMIARLLVAGMLRDVSGCEHCWDTGYAQSGVRDRWGAEKTVGRRALDRDSQNSKGLA